MRVLKYVLAAQMSFQGGFYSHSFLFVSEIGIFEKKT